MFINLTSCHILIKLLLIRGLLYSLCLHCIIQWRHGDLIKSRCVFEVECGFERDRWFLCQGVSSSHSNVVLYVMISRLTRWRQQLRRLTDQSVCDWLLFVWCITFTRSQTSLSQSFREMSLRLRSSGQSSLMVVLAAVRCVLYYLGTPLHRVLTFKKFRNFTAFTLFHGVCCIRVRSVIKFQGNL